MVKVEINADTVDKSLFAQHHASKSTRLLISFYLIETILCKVPGLHARFLSALWGSYKWLLNADWFIKLFASVVIRRRNYFDSGFDSRLNPVLWNNSSAMAMHRFSLPFCFPLKVLRSSRFSCIVFFLFIGNVWGLRREKSFLREFSSRTWEQYVETRTGKKAMPTLQNGILLACC